MLPFFMKIKTSILFVLLAFSLSAEAENGFYKAEKVDGEEINLYFAKPKVDTPIVIFNETINHNRSRRGVTQR